ncbi:hypothetical protein [Micromonospora yangpuensis]|uniref:Uncharacterized protein n=1 Tax=Micromonospora yangpuensis TaxID=683228 RepID=A0A1C6U2D1_9ACTN|nr:hypothetical protein [Micromonospora yangpuensis]GGM10344.1 hypothetical protein GCM10012279_30470 [Micromonospora yangpuensis]SCL48167.1 hypothetical protein GA0070617_0796 [Micromonospora yangpuensis]
MFIEINFTSGLPVDRDDIEDALQELDAFEVVGAGVGELGTNLDVEVVLPISRDEALKLVAELLHRFGVATMACLQVSDPRTRIEVVDLLG